VQERLIQQMQNGQGDRRDSLKLPKNLRSVSEIGPSQQVHQLAVLERREWGVAKSIERTDQTFYRAE
jgi:hypothetical protein